MSLLSGPQTVVTQDTLYPIRFLFFILQTNNRGNMRLNVLQRTIGGQSNNISRRRRPFTKVNVNRVKGLIKTSPGLFNWGLPITLYLQRRRGRIQIFGSILSLQTYRGVLRILHWDAKGTPFFSRRFPSHRAMTYHRPIARRRVRLIRMTPYDSATRRVRKRLQICRILRGRRNGHPGPNPRLFWIGTCRATIRIRVNFVIRRIGKAQRVGFGNHYRPCHLTLQLKARRIVRNLRNQRFTYF